jgi:hypothetical protein
MRTCQNFPLVQDTYNYGPAAGSTPSQYEANLIALCRLPPSKFGYVLPLLIDIACNCMQVIYLVIGLSRSSVLVAAELNPLNFPNLVG